MSKNLFILSLTTLLAFTACEKKEEAKKDGATAEAPKDAKVTPVAVPAPAPVTIPAPAATTEATTAPATAPVQDATAPTKPAK